MNYAFLRLRNVDLVFYAYAVSGKRASILIRNIFRTSFDCSHIFLLIIYTLILQINGYFLCFRRICDFPTFLFVFFPFCYHPLPMVRLKHRNYPMVTGQNAPTTKTPPTKTPPLFLLITDYFLINIHNHLLIFEALLHWKIICFDYLCGYIEFETLEFTFMIVQHF